MATCGVGNCSFFISNSYKKWNTNVRDVFIANNYCFFILTAWINQSIWAQLSVLDTTHYITKIPFYVMQPIERPTIQVAINGNIFYIFGPLILRFPVNKNFEATCLTLKPQKETVHDS